MSSLPRLLRVLLPPTVLAGSLALAAPASAGVSGTTTTSDVVLYQECQPHPIQYDLQTSGLPTSWKLTILVFDPTGRTSEQAVVNSADDPPLHGVVTKTFCGSEDAGTWAVKGIVSSALGDAASPDLPDTFFTVRAPETRTTLAKKRVGPGANRLTARVREETSTGWERADGVPLRLERKTAGGWQPLARVLTASRGRATTLVRGRGTYRVVVPARDNLGGSESGAVSVR